MVLFYLARCAIYAELKQLKGLSEEEINAIVPVSNSIQVYQALIKIVENHTLQQHHCCPEKVSQNSYY